jgi:endonuclease-3
MRKASRQRRAALAEIVFERLSAVEPVPKGELDYVNPFTLLVAVVLSAQATDAGVNKATRSLFAVADTPQKMAALGEEALAARIKTIGLYRSKARHVIALSRAIVDQHGGQTPSDRGTLEALPGVGRKTANVVLGNAFGRNVGVVVDTHVQRLTRRLGLTVESDPEKIERDLMALVPQGDWAVWSNLLIAHGRKVCQARRPLCASCVIADLCPSAEI